MSRQDKIFASEQTAAKLLDLKAADFRQLVSGGVLPPPAKIGPFDRWDVAELHRILSGDKTAAGDEIQW